MRMLLWFLEVCVPLHLRMYVYTVFVCACTSLCVMTYSLYIRSLLRMSPNQPLLLELTQSQPRSQLPRRAVVEGQASPLAVVGNRRGRLEGEELE